MIDTRVGKLSSSAEPFLDLCKAPTCGRGVSIAAAKG
jgi:hypothetical protein